MVSSGGKQVFYNLCQAVLNAGDEVIIPSPYWVSYPDMVILADAIPFEGVFSALLPMLVILP
jgi:aspartate aminotransferase